MRRDVTYSHSKNIGEVLGDFHGVPVQAYDTFDLELDEALDVQQTVLCNQVMGCSDVPNTAEVLPGEVLCADNMIRRTTTAEASGYDEFKEKNPVKMLVGMDLMYDSEDRVWRNPNEWVRLGNGDLIRKQHGQMPAEKLCAWLNDPNNMKKRSFKSRIEVEGDDKLVITDDAKGNPVHAFRYIGGTPESNCMAIVFEAFCSGQYSNSNTKNHLTKRIRFVNFLLKIERDCKKGI